ncbi:PIG-L deacetylase family protein [Spirochaeta isovalerica]|uniref:LmbE family N-acetylglucosaminyl deacetylase n=1 Tax=Spirochaeta isovalerica TaxID=150 RepID=A0A841RBE9_9SPIO|nr:PIG-L deacetylase family protein [Spirochaeta isovalerica]MBB6481295.1 LmbE family N-acetylglucosaminyl deacetylase [Spirochaeta isovalerica]
MSRFNKTVLVVQAHPDDTDAWCSGTLKLLKDKGYRIAIATMTAGGLGGLDTGEEETMALRKNEAARSAEVLGAEYYCLDQRDGYVYDNLEARIKTLELIRKVKPGIVMSHVPNDYHSDHRATAAIVDVATMQATLPNAPCKEAPLDVTPLFYHTAPMTLKGALGEPMPAPQFFIDISTAVETKEKMLACHQSQISLMKKMFNMDNFFEEALDYNRQIGKLCGFEYAECFWQHLGGGFETYPLIQNELKDYLEVSDEFK